MESLITLMKEKLGDDVITEEIITDLRSQIEVAINEKVQSELVTAKEELEEKNAEEMSTFKESLVESIDSYIEYAADEYLKENKVAMDSNVKIEAAEKILEAMKTTLAESGFEVPADKLDVVKDLEEKVEEIQEKLNDSINAKIEDTKQIFEYEKALAFFKKTSKLEESKVSDIEDLLEGLEYRDIDDFNKKVDIVIGKITEKASGTSDKGEGFEDLEDINEETESSIDKYLD